MRRTVWMMAALSLSACLMKDVDRDPKAPIALPAAYQSGEGDAIDPGRWWISFADVELERLVDEALKNNLQLAQAWSRLEQVEAIANGAGAGLSPRVDAQLSAGRSKSPPITTNFGGQTQTFDGTESNSFGASVPVSYEVDVWGRVRAGIYAAEQDTVAVRADVEAAAVTVAANVTERWFDVLEQRALRKLIARQIEVNQLNLELTMLRFDEGDAGLSDIYQQRQQIQLLQAQLTNVRAQELIAEKQLALLLGRAPAKLVSSESDLLPAPPPLPQTGIPATMLERRPDLRSAKARVVAADYRVAQAIAARLPSVSLTGSVGFSSPSLSQFFESVVWNLVGSVAGTIWDGGRLQAEIDRSDAVLDERVAAYGQALLTALVEVESSLVLEKQARARIDIIGLQVRTARATLEAARRRFGGGVGSYLATLTALRSMQQAEQSLLGAKRQLLSARVQVYRALGSRWTSELERPKQPDDEPNNGGDEETT